MKTTLEKIAVMQAFADGQKIEVRNGSHLIPAWTLMDGGGEITWNWHACDYRIAQIPDAIDWSHLTDDIVAVARDDNGRKYMYTEIPQVRTSMFATKPPAYIANHLASYITGNMPWTESLLIRPGHERGCADGLK